MNNDIKQIVEELRVKEKKQEYIDNNERMFQLDRHMAKLTFDREVGLYALTYDRYSDKTKSTEELEKLKLELESLERLESVAYYKAIRREYDRLNNKRDEYFKCVNIDLRRELSRLELPNIYTLQSEYDFDKHIIDKSPLTNEYSKRNIIIVSPIYNMKSIRDFRHFYNKTSFKYLECLSEDYSFELENKKIGKVLIRK